MIKSTFLAGLAVAGYLLAPVTGWAQAHAGRTCGSMQVLERQQAANPDLARKMADIEAQTRQFLANGAYMRSAASTITIPVVVHVVYANSTQNISDAQVQSQIDVLNEDYNKLNADASQVPSAFASVAASYNINFCLAKTDPSGNASTGIVRKSTTKASFTDDDGVKSASTGGDNAWDATKYLNLWACNLGGGLLGYAQFPGGANATDGVVILYSAFGRTGTVSAPYNKGRTATHEVGHWLNLRHIWGDANCGTDYVTDTPTQQTSNYGCPTYPHVTCSNSGDMSMNYMDYTDDACMYMFTAGQYARSAALFATGGSRAGFNTSTACNSVAPPTVCAVPSGLAASNLAATSASLSWGSVNGAASYGVRYRPTGTTAWTNLTSTAASISVTGLTASTGYEAQVQSVCGGTLGNSAYSSSIVFSTTAVQAVSYCAATGGSTTDEWIASVALGLLSQTGPGRSSAGYFDYTSKSANVIIGTAATINYKNGFRSGYSSTEYWRVWVDWNQDGDFADAGEQVVSRSSSSTALLSSSFTPPASALAGKTRMRVFMKYGGYASYCTSASWGQVFDFSLNVSSSRLAAASSALETSLAPNPAADVANLTLRLPQAADATFTLVDLQGRQAWTSTASIGTDAVTVPVPVKGLAKGLYLLHITAGDARKVMKLEVE